MRTLGLAGFLALTSVTAGAQARDSSLLVPFTIEHRAADSTSLDLSFLLDAPAGKHGFVRVRDGHLARGDGARLRLWGIHLTDWSRARFSCRPMRTCRSGRARSRATGSTASAFTSSISMRRAG